MTTNDTPTIETLLESKPDYLSGLTYKARYIGRLLDRRDKWEHDAWAITLRFNGKRREFRFNLGTGHNGRTPELAEVLDALVRDARAGEVSLGEFCADFGYEYEPERLYANSVWVQCQKTSRKLKELFPEDVLKVFWECAPM